MCSLFRNKYRIEPSRLKGHDYSKGSSYFITICTQGKTNWFGNILNQQMILSESGQIAKKLWQELPDHFSFVSLDEYVIMPDHVHGIIVINQCTDDFVEMLHATSLQSATFPAIRHVPHHHRTFIFRKMLYSQKEIYGNKI